MPNTIIVMDNASYHSRRLEPMPIQNWTKSKLIEWLSAHGIQYPDKALKKELWSIVAAYKPHVVRYVVDEMAVAHGHEVVRLPVAHCELNPIELAWAQVKHYVKENNTKYITYIIWYDDH
jgi:transposase